MKKIGYGIIGTGYFGLGLAKIIASCQDASIVAVMDPEHGLSAATELSADIEDTWEALCKRKDVDAVIIASPNYLHKEPVKLAAKNGKHIFCEKPIALSYADCQEMVQVTTENNIVFMAGHIMNFMRGVRYAKECIVHGEIGELLFVHSARNGWEEPQASVSWKKVREKSGGHLYHHIHELDCVQFIMGSAKRVSMVGGNFAHRGEMFGNEDDALFITLDFGNQTYATMQYGSAFHWPDHYVKIFGSKGAIFIDLMNSKVFLKNEAGVVETPLHDGEEVNKDRAYIYNSTQMDGAVAYGYPGKKVAMWLDQIMHKELEFFHEIMLGKKEADEFQPLLDGSAAKSSIATADALTLSMQEGRWVAVTEIQGGLS